MGNFTGLCIWRSLFHGWLPVHQSLHIDVKIDFILCLFDEKRGDKQEQRGTILMIQGLIVGLVIINFGKANISIMKALRVIKQNGFL